MLTETSALSPQMSWACLLTDLGVDLLESVDVRARRAGADLLATLR